MRIFENRDCMDGMKEYPGNHFDMAIVDPEYGIDAGTMTMGKGSGNDTGKHKKKEWDKEPAGGIYFAELFRVSKHQIIWGGNYFINHLKSTQCFLMWDKMDYNSDFASHELAWTSFNKVVKCFRRARSKDGDALNKIHPTQKPVALYRWLLQNYAKEGDLILDTHVGSASSLIACIELGFDYVGYELDSDYYKAATERIKRFEAQTNLFRPIEKVTQTKLL